MMWTDLRAALSALALVTLQGFTHLRTITFSIGYDLGSNCHAYVQLVRELQRIILSLPDNTRLDSLVLEGLFSQTLLNRGWKQSPVVKALRVPLHTFSCRVAPLINRGAQVCSVTVKPVCGVSHARATYSQNEQKRIGFLLGELDQQALLRY